jgi:hypothetical protein
VVDVLEIISLLVEVGGRFAPVWDAPGGDGILSAYCRRHIPRRASRLLDLRRLLCCVLE